MNEREGFIDGYKYASKHIADYVGSEKTAVTSGLYLNNIDSKIEQLVQDINNNANNNPSNHGYLAEYWHADTYNIVAAAMGLDSSAEVLDSAGDRLVKGGADISTSWGQDYGLKYYNTSDGTRINQAKSIEECYREFLSKHPETTRSEYLEKLGLNQDTDFNDSLYAGQARLCPADQLEDITKALDRRIVDLQNNLNNPGRAKLAEHLIETRNQITDHIKSPNGAHSFPLTFEQAKQLQQCSREGKFDPSRYDIELAKLADQSKLLGNSINAGLTSAWTSTIITIAPMMVSLINNAIKDGDISLDDIRNIGTNTASTASTSFLRGLLTSYITTSAKLGYLGNAMKIASKSDSFSAGLATAVTLVLTIASDSIKLAEGEITKSQWEYRIERTIFISSCGYLCGTTMQTIMPELPMIGYMIGSMLGSIAGGILFQTKEKIFISLCVEKGWTFFGLVEQDYCLPEELIKKLGYDIVDDEVIEYDEVKFDEVEYDEVEYEEVEYDEIEAFFVRRSIIGFRKVGYVLS